MGKYTYIILLSVVMALAACSVETDNVDDVEGMWHLTKIETIDSETGTTITENVSDKMIFWSFQHHLLLMEYKEGGAAAVLYKTEVKDKKVALTNPRVDDRENGDPAIESLEPLVPYSIDTLEPVLTIVSAKSSKLVLSTDVRKYYFKKF